MNQKFFLPLTAALLLSGAESDFADTVELNGLTRLFGEDMAFLVLHRTGEESPVNFTLSEGESQFGIKLLTVNQTGHFVEIQQDGSTRHLHLCSTPDLTLPAEPAPDSGIYPLPKPLAPQEQVQVERFLNDDPDVQRVLSGNPVVNMVYAGGPASANSSSSGSGNSSTLPQPVSASIELDNSASPGSTSSGGTPGTGTAASAGSANNASNSAPGASTDYTQEYWYKASLGIEQTRLATATEVSNGILEPLPRTPLTPPGTPAGLIGSDTYFSTHIPGFVDGSSPNN